MCGIAGVIHRNGNSKIGEEMSSMLQAMKHRGPDSTGFALYCERNEGHADQYVMRMKVPESHETAKGYDIHAKMEERIKNVEVRLKELKEESLQLRLKNSSEQLENTARIKQVRREIAQLNTLLTAQSKAK